MGYIREDELIQFPNQDNGTAAVPGSHSASRPNCCPIQVSCMILLAESVSAKPLPDLCQLHAIARRVHLGQTVARSMSATNCRS